MIASGSSRLMSWNYRHGESWQKEEQREDAFEVALEQDYQLVLYSLLDRFYVNVERLAVRRLSGSQGVCACCAVLNMSRRYIGSPDESLHALYCSQGARVDILLENWSRTENLELFWLKCTYVDSGNCMNLVSDSKRHDSPTLFENSYWAVAVIPDIQNWN